jgi:hypothetical protein
MGNLFTTSYSLSINSTNSNVYFTSPGSGGTILDLLGWSNFFNSYNSNAKTQSKTIKDGENFGLEIRTSNDTSSSIDGIY